MSSAGVLRRMYHSPSTDLGWVRAQPTTRHQRMRSMAAETMAGLAGFSIVLVISGAMAAVLVGSGITALPTLIRRRLAKRAGAADAASLPQLCEAVSRSIRSGASINRALSEACDSTPSSFADELRQVLAQSERGLTISQALAGWARQSSDAHTRIVAAALSLAADNEASSARALDGAAQTLRDRLALSAEVGSLAAQAMASMSVLVGLPVGLLVIDALTGMQALGYLTGDSIGRLCLGAGIGLDVVGWLWMRRLVARRMQG